MEICKCGKEFEKKSSLKSHARFCLMYEKNEKKKTIYENKMCECGRSFDTAQGLNGHFSFCLIHRNGNPISRKEEDKNAWCGWNKGKTKTDHPSIERGGKKFSEKIKNGEIIPSFSGKKHSLKTRQQMSDSANEKNNGYIKTKYYEIFCPYENTTLKVQGTWELKFAELLNTKKINWTKKRSIYISYKFNDIHKRYFPDFFLPDRNQYIEIKGYWFKSSDGRIDDRRKMNLVKEQNVMLDIVILDNMILIENFN